MANQSVTITAAMRNNLLSLQNTQRMTDKTQNILATGKKVNSALDDANAFFASQSLLNRASDLGRLLDGMGQAIQVIKAADQGITLITSYLEQMQATAQEALDQANAAGAGEEPADKTALDATMGELADQINTAIKDAGYRGTNLLAEGDLTVTFNERTGADQASLTVTGVDFSTGTAGVPEDPGPPIVPAVPGTGLGIGDTFSFDDADAAEAILANISAALTTIRGQSRALSSNLSIIQGRQDFTENLINTLKEGSDKLVLADQNEQGAYMLALQTQQQLGVTSLSLASQAQQSILRLF